MICVDNPREIESVHSHAGVSTVDYASLPYKYLRRPIWPIDKDLDWSAIEAEAAATADRLAVAAAAEEQTVAVETDR
jgi:hypothetical protein